MDNTFPGNARLQPGPVVTKAGLEPGAPRDAPRGWHSRGYMPHFDSHHVVQHVTFHLADSLPASVLAHRNGRMPSGANASRSALTLDTDAACCENPLPRAWSRMRSCSSTVCDTGCWPG